MNNKITILMNTFNRNQFFLDKDFCIYALAKNKLVNKIYIMWNNIHIPEIPSPILKIIKSLSITNIIFVKQIANKVSNKFNISDLETTSCILMLDDDIYLPEDMLQTFYDTWLNDQNGLVGSVYRSINSYKYSSGFTTLEPRFNMLLTGSLMFHKKMLIEYEYHKDNINKIVDKYTNNGEDILFNMMCHHVFNSQIYSIHNTTNYLNDWVPKYNFAPINKLCSRPDHFINRIEIFNDGLTIFQNFKMT